MSRVKATNLEALAEVFGGKTSSSFQINEENTNDASIAAVGNSVKFIGSGIAGSGTVEFDSAAEAKEFETFLEDLRDVGLLEEVISGDLDWDNLAEGAGATKSREIVGRINETNLWANAVREFESKKATSSSRLPAKAWAALPMQGSQPRRKRRVSPMSRRHSSTLGFRTISSDLPDSRHSPCL